MAFCFSFLFHFLIGKLLIFIRLFIWKHVLLLKGMILNKLDLIFRLKIISYYTELRLFLIVFLFEK